MQTVVDSKERPLPAPTVITTALGELDLGGITPAAAMAGIAKEMTMKDTDMVQIGNTVFIGHRGKGENKDLMWGRALNIDTAQNFVANGLKYFTHMQKIGVKRYVSDYDGAIYDSAFKAWKRYADKLDTKIAVGRKATGGSRAYVTLGKLPLNRTT
jgi:hypothetical protein|tara:strand:+ start:32 stop:499 length:468 start_codon:yes stop_codon:yes gene_type:complete